MTLVKSAKIKEVSGSRVVFDAKDAKDEVVEADTVIVSLMKPDNQLSYGQFGSYKAEKVSMIGDRVKVRRLFAAIHDGYRMGMRIGYEQFQYANVAKAFLEQSTKQ